MSSPEHLPALARLMPQGPFALEEGTLIWEELSVIGAALDSVETSRRGLLTELHPGGAGVLLANWESMLATRGRGLPTATRRARIIAHLRLVPDMCPATIEARIEEFTGMDWTLTEARAFVTDRAWSLCDSERYVVDGAHVFVLQGSSATAHLLPLRRSEMLAFLESLKPAHTLGIVRLDDFFTDDPLSLTDTDLLGA